MFSANSVRYSGLGTQLLIWRNPFEAKILKYLWARAENEKKLSDFGCFLANSGHYCWGGAASLWSEHTLLVMKIEWLVTNVTADRSLARAESEEFRVFDDVFRPIQAAFVVGKPLCDLELPAQGLQTLLRIIWWK